MLPTIIVGTIFFALIGFGAYKSIKSMKNNSCPGCSGGCSEQTKKNCGK
ncbi:FeoB-associated Cys-rich membrane protein [Petroclostridium sp. X23]|nr:FeoB-associated Cys-rich membrane protein [Petroclostridium sp. X23]WHH58736.1 FeoB-associated Cys-rich membrane protein [Petroclostridium sp. X23]